MSFSIKSFSKIEYSFKLKSTEAFGIEFKFLLHILPNFQAFRITVLSMQVQHQTNICKIILFFQKFPYKN